MKTFFTAIAVVLGFAGSAIAAEPVIITPKAATAWLAETPAVQVVDVRTKEEFATGHLAKAILIPWTDKDFTARATKELDPKKPVLVYCRSGRRSTAAAAALAKLGFTDIRNLEGGITAYQNSEHPSNNPE